jgi:hypothetical protein
MKRIQVSILVVLLLGGVVSYEIFCTNSPDGLVIAADGTLTSAADLQGESDLRIKQHIADLRRGYGNIEGSLSGIESGVDSVSGAVEALGSTAEDAIERVLEGIGVIESRNRRFAELIQRLQDGDRGEDPGG